MKYEYVNLSTASVCLHTVARIERMNGRVNNFEPFVDPELQPKIGKVFRVQQFNGKGFYTSCVIFIYEFIFHEFIYEYHTMNL